MSCGIKISLILIKNVEIGVKWEYNNRVSIIILSYF